MFSIYKNTVIEKISQVKINHNYANDHYREPYKV